MIPETKRLPAVIGLALALLAPMAVRAAPARKGGDSLASIAVAFVHELAQGDYQAAEADFTGQMRQAAPADALGRLWKALVNQAGTFQGTGRTRTVDQSGYRTVIVKADFKRRALGIAVTFDSGRRIAGMHIVAAP